MPHAADPQEFAVLFVDDEGESCEALADALAGRLRVVTADSVDEALAVLERQGEHIGVLLTDQRMPGRTGVDLLKLVRERWPAIVRLLTTAYTDYDDAIAAVNRGEILRYIHKPWDIRSLRMELEHAMELFVLRREREHFIEEKLSVSQRLAEAGRARDLLILCSTLGLRNTAPAVADFLAHWRGGTPKTAASRVEQPRPIPVETQRSMAIARELRTLLEGTVTGDRTPTVPAVLLTDAAANIGVAIEGLNTMDSLPTVDLPRATAGRLLELLIEAATAMASADGPLSLAATANAAGIVLNLGHDGPCRQPPLGNGDEGAMSLARQARLLAAFLLCRHLGGELSFHGGRITCALPFAPAEASAAEAPCIERIFAAFEADQDW